MEAPDLCEIADQPEGFERLAGRRSLAAIHSCINRRLGQAYPLVGCTHSLAYFLRTSIGAQPSARVWLGRCTYDRRGKSQQRSAGPTHLERVRAMTERSRNAGAFLVVGLEYEGEELARITEILEPLGIPTEVVGRGHQLRRAPSVVLRVPQQRVGEAILALELQGYGDVLAYQLEES
jgi:hypothetical protein